MKLNTTTWLEVINQALIIISETPLQNMNQNVQVSGVASGLLPQVIEEVYGALPNNDLAVWTQLAEITQVPGSPYSRRFAIPKDSARILEVRCDGSWLRTSDAIDTDAGSVQIRYVRFPSDPADMPFYARSLCVLLLASRMALPLASDQNLSTSLYNQYIQNRANAIALAQRVMPDTPYRKSVSYEELFADGQ